MLLPCHRCRIELAGILNSASSGKHNIKCLATRLAVCKEVKNLND